MSHYYVLFWLILGDFESRPEIGLELKFLGGYILFGFSILNIILIYSYINEFKILVG